MRAVSMFIFLMVWIANIAIAQKADSIVVKYNNQEISIPVPAFGKQTTIKMADTVQMIEIGVSRRKISEIKQLAQFPSSAVTAEKPLKGIKWLSQAEAGYIISFINKDRFPFYNTNPNFVDHINNDPLQGFNLGLSVLDRERILKNKLSYNIGLKFGFVEQFRADKPKNEIPYDTINQVHHMYIDYDPYAITSLQLLMPVGIRYSFSSGKAISKICFGANIGTSFNIQTWRGDDGNLRNYTSLTPVVLQPYFGIEFSKIGLLSSLAIPMTNGSVAEIKYSLGFSMTYRFF